MRAVRNTAHRSRNSKHESCAHPSDGHSLKPSSLPSACDSPAHECQQIRSQNGATIPAPCTGCQRDKRSATKMHRCWCSCPSNPPAQIASTRGRTSFRTYISRAARLSEGGGGGARAGSYQRRVVSPGGGGGAAAAEIDSIPEASLASHCLMRAYMRSAGPTPDDTKMHLFSPLRTTRFEPPSDSQCITTSPFSVFGLAAQKAYTPVCRAYASVLMASTTERGRGSPRLPGAGLFLSGTSLAMAAASACDKTLESSRVAGMPMQSGSVTKKQIVSRG